MEIAGYYLDRIDGEGDMYACAPCTLKYNKSTDHPCDEEVMKWAPIQCGIHVYGANPAEYV